jgi:hemoglobin
MLIVTDTSPLPLDDRAGHNGLTHMINAFYHRVEQDEALRPLFPGGVSQAHREHVTSWWSATLGGPAGCTTERDGHEAMLVRGPNRSITVQQRFRFASLMSLLADDAQLPAQPEFRLALVGYLEWATRIAMHHCRADTDVVEHQPALRWREAGSPLASG